MNHLIEIRTNILYSKKENKDKPDSPAVFERFQELIFLFDKPLYRFSNEGNIIRERGVEETRFTVSAKEFETMLEILEKLKNAEPSELE